MNAKNVTPYDKWKFRRCLYEIHNHHCLQGIAILDISEKCKYCSLHTNRFSDLYHDKDFYNSCLKYVQK